MVAAVEVLNVYTVNRRTLMIALRLRSGNFTLRKSAHLMRKASSPNCPVCGIVEDVHLYKSSWWNVSGVTPIGEVV